MLIFKEQKIIADTGQVSSDSKKPKIFRSAGHPIRLFFENYHLTSEQLLIVLHEMLFLNLVRRYDISKGNR
jgi:hypothetical protein